jgi:hypothetical protein
MGRPERQWCERCGRLVEAGRVWQLGIDVPPDGRVERTVCAVCAAEVRRYLLAPPATAQPVPAAKIEDPETSWAGRLGWPAARAAAYVCIALGAFVVVTWLITR